MNFKFQDMQNRTFDRLLLFSIFFLAHWFFGNLYEQVVLAPNQLAGSYDALVCWQRYFKITNPIYYYVPFTQLAIAAIWLLYFRAKDPLQKRMLKKAVAFGSLAILLTIIIVTQLNTRLFFGDLNAIRESAHTLSVLWFAGNAVRLFLVGTTLYYVFQTYVTRIRHTAIS